MSVQLRLAIDDPHAAGAARLAMDGLAGVTPYALESVRLLVSELVTNCFRHAGHDVGDWIDLTATVRSGLVRVTVCDRGGGFDRVPTRPTSGEASGWGLYLVDRISKRWGVDRGAGSFCVWFEVVA